MAISYLVEIEICLRLGSNIPNPDISWRLGLRGQARICKPRETFVSPRAMCPYILCRRQLGGVLACEMGDMYSIQYVIYTHPYREW